VPLRLRSGHDLWLIGDLKKQSQFTPTLMGATSFIKGNYDNKVNSGAQENKAKQSQFYAPASLKGTGKIGKSVPATTG